MMRSIAHPAPLARAAILVAVLAAVASCTTSTPAPSPVPNPAPAPSAGSPEPALPAAPTQAAPSSHPPAPATGAACATGAWHSAPLNITRDVAAPLMPLVAGVRAATHPECGYDRFVLTFTGPVPSYYIRHVSQVLADPSGKPINLPGPGYLLITLRPAQAHTDSGAATIARGVQPLGYPMLRGYALEGDFEGVINLALGLHGTASFRAGELPGRLYVDVKI
jgi:hypothetical protein